MPLSTTQVKKIKEQLLSQIEKLPKEQQADLKKQVSAMNSAQLEQFLIQNNMLSPGENPENLTTQQDVFQMILDGKIPSKEISANKEAIAVLEINPISKGHVIIIPREKIKTSDEIPEAAFLLARKVAKKIKKELSPKEIGITSWNTFGRSIINVFPIYEDENIFSDRKKADETELAKLQKQLAIKPEEEKIVEKPIEKLDSNKSGKYDRPPRRIP